MRNRLPLLLSKIITSWSFYFTDLKIKCQVKFLQYPLTLVIFSIFYVLFIRNIMVVYAEEGDGIYIPGYSEIAWYLFGVECDPEEWVEQSGPDGVFIPFYVFQYARDFIGWILWALDPRFEADQPQSPLETTSSNILDTSVTPAPVTEDITSHIGKTIGNPDLAFLTDITALPIDAQADAINEDLYHKITAELPEGNSESVLKQIVKDTMLSHVSYHLWFNPDLGPSIMEKSRLAMEMFKSNSMVLASGDLDHESVIIVKHINTHLYFIVQSLAQHQDLDVLLDNSSAYTTKFNNI